MQRVAIANIPDEVYQKLEQQAEQNGKSVEELAAEYLRKAIEDEAAEATLLAEIRKEREAMDVYVTDDDLQRAKNWGRE